MPNPYWECAGIKPVIEFLLAALSILPHAIKVLIGSVCPWGNASSVGGARPVQTLKRRELILVRSLICDLFTYLLFALFFLFFVCFKLVLDFSLGVG